MARQQNHLTLGTPMLGFKVKYSRLWLTALAALCAAACGRTLDDDAPSETTGGASPAGIGGTGNAGTLGRGGSSAGFGQAESGSGGVRPRVPGETEEETRILDPLFEGDGAIETASGEELVRLGASVGLAHGYAMCRCLPLPGQALRDPMELLACAREESGLPGRARGGDAERCLGDAIAADRSLEVDLRCEIRNTKSYGRAWLELCWQDRSGELPGMAPLPMLAPQCSRSEKLEYAVLHCQGAHYCPDGKLVDNARCNSVADCEDASDERACFEVRGRDMLKCGERITDPRDICRPDACADLAPPGCEAARPERLVCGDGSEVSTDVVCDRVADCPDGVDEGYCLR